MQTLLAFSWRLVVLWAHGRETLLHDPPGPLRAEISVQTPGLFLEFAS